MQPEPPPHSPPPEVFAICADLVFSSRIRATAEANDAPVRIFSSVAQLLDAAASSPPDRVLVDLELRSGDPVRLIADLKADPRTQAVEVIAFVSHVREDRIAAARDAGANRVLARSAFVRQLPTLLAGR